MKSLILQAESASAGGVIGMMATLVVVTVSMATVLAIISPGGPISRDAFASLWDTIKQHYVADIVILLLALVALWYFRPWFHGFFQGLYTSPQLVSAIALSFVVVVAVALVANRLLGAVRTVGVGTGVLVILVVLSFVAAPLYSSHTLGDETMGDAAQRDTIPTIDADHPRILTRATADRYASNSLQTPKFRAVGSDITIYNDTSYWSYALAPDGTRNWLLEEQNGTVLVNMETQSKDVQVIDQDMQVGQGMGIRDSYQWRVLKESEFLVDYQEPFMVIHNDSQYMAVPYTKPNHHMRFTPFPAAYTTPEWGGVALVHSDGTIEDLSPEEARAHPVLEEQRLVPFDLVRQKVAATAYRNGVVNTLPVVGSHHEQIEVAPVPGDGNDQPFFVRTEDGLRYVVAVEPYGDTQGIREVWVVDARTEEYEAYRSPDGSTLLGPRRAADYVRQASRQTDWDRFTPAEPIPVVVDDTLYWEVRVVPNDASGISYVAFVNAETSDVVGVEETEEVVDFMRGDEVDPVVGNQTTDQTPALVVQKIGENGNVVEEIEVYDNESVNIEREGE